MSWRRTRPQAFPPLENTREINGGTVVAFEPGCAYRRYLEAWLLDSEIVPGGVISVGSYLAMLACVSAGTSFAVVPRSVLETVSTKGRFRLYPLPDEVARIKTLLAWRSDYRSAKMDALKQLLPPQPVPVISAKIRQNQVRSEDRRCHLVP